MIFPCASSAQHGRRNPSGPYSLPLSLSLFLSFLSFSLKCVCVCVCEWIVQRCLRPCVCVLLKLLVYRRACTGCRARFTVCPALCFARIQLVRVCCCMIRCIGTCFHRLASLVVSFMAFVCVEALSIATHTAVVLLAARCLPPLSLLLFTFLDEFVWLACVCVCACVRG